MKWLRGLDRKWRRMIECASEEIISMLPQPQQPAQRVKCQQDNPSTSRTTTTTTSGKIIHSPERRPQIAVGSRGQHKSIAISHIRSSTMKPLINLFAVSCQLLAFSFLLTTAQLTTEELKLEASTATTSFSTLTSSTLTSSSSLGPAQEMTTTRLVEQPAQPISGFKGCQVSGGESVAILDIEESRHSDFSQSTNPVELPILGSADSIELKIESESHNYFRIDGKRLRLTRPLNRDGVLKESDDAAPFQFLQQPISSIYLQISCHEKQQPSDSRRQQQQAGNKLNKIIIPVLVKLIDINDNEPKFSSQVYETHVSELATPNTIILDNITALDLDSAQNGLVEFSLVDVWPSSQPMTPSTMPTTQRLTQRDATTTTTSFVSLPTTSRQQVPAVTVTAEPATSRSPTFNLESEPIVNGPMGEPDDDDSDEALLAAMNSTDQDAGDNPNESFVGRRRRRRQVAPRWLSFRRQLVGDNMAASQPAIDKPRDLWTNLLGDEPAVPAGGRLSSSGDSAHGAKRMKLTPGSLDYFSLEVQPGTNKPVLKLKRALDYEAQRTHVLGLLATDRAANRADRLTGHATIVVRVLDGDDQGPVFVLDQGGCATSSVSYTTPVGLATSASPPSDVHRRQLDDEELPPVSPRLPHGFKVIDENFDFSDSQPEGTDSAPTTGSDNQEAGQRTRRFQPTIDLSTIKATSRLPLTTTVGQALRADHYSCLSEVPKTGESGQTEYFSRVMSGESDYLLRVAPQAIKARDRDEMNSPIVYSFINGTPSDYSSYFQINPLDATIKQVAPLEFGLTKQLTIWIQAQEQTAQGLASIAKLTIEVMPSDKSPPALVPTSSLGYLYENSPLGSDIMIDEANMSQPLIIRVLDADSLQRSSTGKSPLMYEFETTSDAFKVRPDGRLFVNRWPLDRDPPNGQKVHLFQVTARRMGFVSSKSVSAPISLNVTLLDQNDNPPSIANESLAPVQLPASGSPNSVKQLTVVRLVDADESHNARAKLSIRHVSNGGRGRFRLEEDSGQLEALGKFQTGEQFSLTLQAEDPLGRVAQGILEVVVVPGPNSAGPQFVAVQLDDRMGLLGAGPLTISPAPSLVSQGSVLPSRGYAVIVNEGVAPHSAIFQLQAQDPENDPINYSILEGNINNDFYVNSKTGTVFVANKLDREEVSGYSLLMEARDSGGLAATRYLHISVSDINDQNPVFSAKEYRFSTKEGPLVGGTERLVGRVSASDADAGENGRLSFSLSSGDGSPTQTFTIDSQTGELYLREPLDFERQTKVSLLVTAKDHGEEPRSASASILVQVIDVPDEPPYFEKSHLEAKLNENQGTDQRVAQVQAKDPDGQPQISYYLAQGDGDLFAVDQTTGLVTTRRSLDYESATSHLLLIGLLENKQPEPNSSFIEQLASGQLSNSALCRIDVTVLDTNDHAPQFVGQPLPVRVQDTALLGTEVIRIEARDSDRSAPNNQVRYELIDRNNKLDQGDLITNDRCAQWFMVDPVSGGVLIKSDLKLDSVSECQLIIRARDLGLEPRSLSSSTSIIIYVDHLAGSGRLSQLSFADSQFTIELEENTPANSLVKVLPIINRPKDFGYTISCEIVAGNELGKFFILENEQRDCEIRTKDIDLDYEQRSKYALTVRLNVAGLTSKPLALVQVNLIDKNDNKPLFQPALRYAHLTQNKFLAAIPSDAPVDSQVAQLRASDADSALANGLVSYELLELAEDQPEVQRFKVDPVDGIVRTCAPMEDIASSRLPLKLKLLARDNPEQPAASLSSSAELVVNLIEDKHRIALVLRDTATHKALDSKEELLSLIQQRSGFISGMEKAESMKLERNGSLEPDVSGTDFWFYLVEPGTLKIMSSDDPRLRQALFEPRGQSFLLDSLDKQGFPGAKIRLPFLVGNSLVGRSSTSANQRGFLSYFDAGSGGIATSLILVGLFIAFTGTIVIIYQCGSWSASYPKASKKQQPFMASQPQIYHPASSLIGPQSQESLNFRSSFPSIASHPNHHHHQSNSQLSSFQFRNDQLMAQQSQQMDPYQPATKSNYTTNSNIGQQQQYGKEYETQMLKMSVIFDDCNSIAEAHQQNSHQLA